MIPPGGSTAPPRETFGGATVNELAHEGIYQNSRLSFIVLQRLIDELAAVSCAPELYMTPFREFPDHHALVFLRNGVLELTLGDDILDALVRAKIVVKNPHQRRKTPQP